MFKTYKASAGAGKTTNLVAEYLAICLKDIAKYRHVLAITFTNNATAEMKSRIVHTLQQFSTHSYEQLGRSDKAVFDIVQQLSGLDATVVIARSAQLLEKILFDYQNFTVSTIDSFFQRILRSFAYELGLNMNYSVEITLDDYYEQTIDTLYNKISKEEPELTRKMLAMVNNQLSENGYWNVDKELQHFLHEACTDELSAIPLAELKKIDYAGALSALNEQILKTKKDLEALLAEGRALLESTGLPATAFESKRSTSIYKWFEKASVDKMPTSQFLQLAIEDKTSFLKEGYADDRVDVDLRQQYLKIRETFCSCEKLKYFYKNMRDLHLLFDLKELIDEIRERDNKFFLSDTNYTINSEIKDEETPFIYEKVGNKYEFFFIDEFQDTSKMQWENLLPLIKEALANGNKGILFGDVKQAIYRFRNGDAQLFGELTSNKAASLMNAPHQSCSLDTNFRSDGYIIEFNNRFFEKLPDLYGFPSIPKDEYVKYYADVAQKTDPDKEKKGFVCVEFAPRNDMVPFNEYMKKQVLWAVDDALSCGFKYQDMAILSPRKSMGSAVGKILSEKGIPVISADSLLLSSSDEVNLIITFLRYFFNYQDNLSKLMIINILLRLKPSRKSLSDMLSIFMPDKEGQKAVSDEQLWSESEKKFTDLLKDEFQIIIDRDAFMELPLYSLVNKIIEVAGLNIRSAFVVGFIDELVDYLSANNGELGYFLEWWDKMSSSLAILPPENIDAIKISTVHKAKGLQYPVVIMLFPMQKKKKTKSEVWYKTPDGTTSFPYVKIPLNKDMLDFGSDFAEIYTQNAVLDILDYLNVAYVAQTRPQNAMYIFSSQLPENLTDKPDERYLHYNLMMNDFIHSNDGDALADGFTQDENNALRFWFHIENHKVVNEFDFQANTVEEKEEVGKLPINSFGLENLSGILYPDRETEEQRIGNVVHDFLSSLKLFPQNVEEVEKMVFDENQLYQDEIRSALRRLVDNDSYHRYFAPEVKVLNEVSILENSDELVAEGMGQQLIYRPDRVVLLEDETVVIDYKTGSPNEKTKEKYLAQVEKYVSLLAKMNFPNVHGELIYL